MKKLLRFLFTFVLSFQTLLFLLRALFIKNFNIFSFRNFEIKIVKDFNIINVIFARDFLKMSVLLRRILLITIFKICFATNFATILNDIN